MAAILKITISFLVYLTSCSCGLSNARTLNDLSPSNTTSSIFPALIALGDSTLDTGNNNFIKSIMTSNHLPYGLNFPNHLPTGRFSDGKLIPDLIASSFGIKETIPPFLDPSLTTQDLATGVCFASAGAGYDEITNVEFGVIPVMKQLDMFKSYIAKLMASVGEEKAKSIINGALYVISAGSNDLAVTYYDLGMRKLQFPDVGGYHDFIQSKLVQFVKELYKQGARIMLVAGLPPLGCLPIQRTAALKPPFDQSCIEHQNSDSQVYNRKLQKALGSLNLPGATILYGNVYDPLLDMMNNPHKYGLEETKVGCCGTGVAELAGLCNEATPLCADTSKYLFFDSIHPTQAAYKPLVDYLVKDIPTPAA